MNNRPYNPADVNALEAFQIKRLEVVETAAVQLAALISRNFPALKPNVDEILSAAGRGAFQAEENAAELYLKDLYPAVVFKADANGENTKALNTLVTKYFPLYFGQPSPLSLNPDKLMAVFDKEQHFDDDANIDYTTLTQAIAESYLTDENNGGLWKTRLINPLDQAIATVIFRLEKSSHQYVAIAPREGQYAFIALDNDNQHYFIHRQAQYFSVDAIDAVLRANFLKSQSAAIRSLYSAKGDGVTKVQVLITQIAKVWDPAKIKLASFTAHNSYFQAMLQPAQLERVTEAALYVKTSHTEVELLIDITRTEAVLMKSGGQLIAVKYEDLPVVSLNLLIDVLTEALQILKPKKTRSKK